MKNSLLLFAIASMFSGAMMYGQNQSKTRELGHTNQNKFKQLYEEFATPNMYRTGSGAPGSAYYQQQADYKMDIDLDDANKKITGKETITYTNNSPDNLEFLWVQLDTKFMSEPFDGGFTITAVKDASGKPLPHTINRTMMRVEMPKDLEPGGKFVFSIDWWYNINDHVNGRGRSGYEEFEDGNRAYVIAQFYPRMAVYNDVEGWQNHQFWGRGEFALPFGNFEVNITVPSDHILDATGKLQNRKEVFTKDMMDRYEKAKKSSGNLKQKM